MKNTDLIKEAKVYLKEGMHDDVEESYSVPDRLVLTIVEAQEWNPKMDEARLEKKFIYKQVERGLFDKHTSPEQALKNIAFWPDAPWASDKWNWDVSHKEYADEFYKLFPPITEETND